MQKLLVLKCVTAITSNMELHFRSLIPINLYGQMMFSLDNSHVLPAWLLHSSSKANKSTIYASNRVAAKTKKFIHVDDLASHCFQFFKKLLKSLDEIIHINVGIAKISIKDL